jgi:hypothetical protein
MGNDIARGSGESVRCFGVTNGAKLGATGALRAPLLNEDLSGLPRTVGVCDNKGEGEAVK